jgi:hypothetical protein
VITGKYWGDWSGIIDPKPKEKPCTGAHIAQGFLVDAI